jgi:hypothetical protein
MDRERDEADPSPGEQPRRRQVTISEEDRDRIERHLERMPLERDALLLAMRQFGAGFDRDAWQTGSNYVSYGKVAWAAAACQARPYRSNTPTTFEAPAANGKSASGSQRTRNWYRAGPGRRKR